MAKDGLEETVSSLKQDIKELAETNKNYKHELERLRAAREVENIVNKYENLLSTGQYEEVLKLFALKTPGVRAELGNSGVYEGVEGIERLFGPGGVHEWMQGKTEALTPGVMFLQPNMTPIIEVAGDGKTAKGLWHTLGPSTVLIEGKPQAGWLMSKRAYDFVKEDGEWKIWHYHVYFLIQCSFDKSWTAQEKVRINDSPSKCPAHLRPDKPTTYYWIYTPTSRVEYIPAVPLPYETFEETFSY